MPNGVLVFFSFLTRRAVQIFVLSSSRIQQRGYDTLFNYTTANPKSGVSKFVKQFPIKTQVYTVVTLSLEYSAHCIYEAALAAASLACMWL